MNKINRPSFVLGFAAAIGALLAVGTVAVARPHSSARAKAPARVDTPVPSRAPLAVLRRPRNASDDLPEALEEDAAGLAGGPELAPAVRNGAVSLPSSRLALSDLGEKNASLYLVPTAKGRICLLLTNGPEGCDTLPFTPARPANWGLFDTDGYRTGSPTGVYGIVPNNVDRVTVVDDRGTRTDARLANNAYYLELGNGAAMPKSIILRFTDGASATMEVPTLTVG
jgi:hypothetical protein